MTEKSKFVNPFYRPWMTTYGAAAPAGGSNKGLKGIVAGEKLYYEQYYGNIFKFPIVG